MFITIGIFYYLVNSREPFMTKYNSEKDLSLDQILSSIKKIILEEKPVNEQTKPLELNKEKFNKKENKEKEAKDQEGDILDLTEVVNIGLQNQKSYYSK